MARLKHPNQVPPRGYVYFQKETRLLLQSDNLKSLVDLVIAHRKQKSLGPTDPAYVRSEIERQICTRLGTEDCKPEGISDGWVPQGRADLITVGSILSASRAAFAILESGFELAPKEEMTRRAKVCLDCPLNQPVSGCACAPLYKLIAALVPADRKPDGLHVCLVCKCSLQAKVNLTDEQIRAANANQNYPWPENPCWQKELAKQ